MLVCKLIYYLMDHKLLDEDIASAGYHTFSEAMSNSRPFRNIFLCRLRQQSKIKYRIARLFCHPIDSLEINVVSNSIGGGFTIWHGYSTVIFCREIGNHVSINQSVTIGKGKTINGVDIPKIENNVKIYTGAVIIGGITIGSNSIIGANAVVTHDVAPGSVVAGVPARVIRENK